MDKTLAIKIKFEKALEALKKALSQPENDFIRDSSIHRFEFTIDLGWKFVKAYLEESLGILVYSPKESFKIAFKQGLISYDIGYIDMVDMRNETSHTYNEIAAEEIYRKLPKALELLTTLDENISSKLSANKG